MTGGFRTFCNAYAGLHRALLFFTLGGRVISWTATGRRRDGPAGFYYDICSGGGGDDHPRGVAAIWRGRAYVWTDGEDDSGGWAAGWGGWGLAGWRWRDGGCSEVFGGEGWGGRKR